MARTVPDDRLARLVECATQVFIEQGYRRTQMADVAKALGVAKGTLYHYPNINNHQILSLAGAPAPHKIGEQIYVQALMTQMAVRYFRGEAMEKTLDWAANELEGFTRN